MDEIRIKLLSLLNFKGLKAFEITDFSNGICIYGDNATGKTTIFDAFSWLLFGKDSLNSAVFEIKHLTDTGEPLHGLQHEVEAILVHGDTETSFRKVFSEKYTKHRGQAKQTFTGHTVDHYVQGVPCKQKEFQVAVNEMCTEDVFRLLTNPRHFNEVMHWTGRRTLLLDVCGDISDQDVIAANPDLDRLATILGNHILEDAKKIINGKRAEINRELQKIPTRTDEISKTIVEIADSDCDINEKIMLYQAEKNTAEKNLATVKAGGGIAKKQKKLAELQAEILVHKNKIAETDLDRRRTQKKEFQEAEDKAIASAKASENMVKEQTMWIKNKKDLMESLAAVIKDRDILRKHWIEVDGGQFVPAEGENICPACGQKLPAKDIEKAARLALENFNLDKAKSLAAISEKGRAFHDKIKTIEEKIKSATQMISDADESIQDLSVIQDTDQKAVDDLKAHHEKINLTIPPDDVLNDMIAAEDSFKLDINAISAGNNEILLAAEGDVSRINDMLSLLVKDQLQIEANERVAERINELGKQERALAAEYEGLEADMFVIETFIRQKVSMLESKINKKFKHATFRLFTENISGGLEECCDTTYGGVPYNSMNNGARINIGLDICNTLSEHYGISLPCFIDNAEAVSKIIDTNAQQIKLFVSENDKTLRIENS
jgi:DNA repair exonuclease SbcCD ATPase subunit